MTDKVIHRPSSPAEQLLAIEVFCELLAATDPSVLGGYITGQIRELTGARMVFLITHDTVTGKHLALDCSPERKRELFADRELELFCPQCTPGDCPFVVGELRESHPLKAVLESKGFTTFLRIPLALGKQLTGLLLLLELPEPERLPETRETLNRLAPMMTIALQNAFSHQEAVQLARDLERRVEEQTAELRAAKEKAEESDRLKTAFLANMSHEIRTPMNGILGFLEILQDPSLNQEERREYIDIVNKSGQRLLETINDIIEISRIETGTMSTHLSRVSLKEVLTYQHDFFDRQASGKGLGFYVRNELPPEGDLFVTDRHKLDGIITNLVRNAIKFTEKGYIEIGCRERENQLVLSVKDTGHGIPPERQSAIFDRFVQAETDIARPHEGSGLGLSIVKAYVDILDGELRLESRVGEGSLFSVILPRKTL